MHAIKQDLTYALRLLVKQPGVTFIAILTLALGIGANTAIFSAVNAILLRPLPYADPDRLVMVFEKRLAEGVLDNVVSPADFLDWSKMNGAFDGIAAMSGANADLTGVGEPIRLCGRRGLAAVLRRARRAAGARPQLPARGSHRRAAPRGDSVARPLAAPLRFRRVDRRPQDPAERRFLMKWSASCRPPSSSRTPSWRSGRRSRSKADTQAPSRVNHFLNVYARLKPGVTLERARAEMDRVGAQLQTAVSRGQPQSRRARVAARATSSRRRCATAFWLFSARSPSCCSSRASTWRTCCSPKRRRASARWRCARRSAPAALRLAGQTLTESVLLALLRRRGGRARGEVGHRAAAAARAAGRAGARRRPRRARSARPRASRSFCRSAPACSSACSPRGTSQARTSTSR